MPHARQSLQRWTGSRPVTCGNRSGSEREGSTALDRASSDSEAPVRTNWENGPDPVQSSESSLHAVEMASEHAYCIPREAADMEGFVVEG